MTSDLLIYETTLPVRLDPDGQWRIYPLGVAGNHACQCIFQRKQCNDDGRSVLAPHFACAATPILWAVA